MKFLITGVVLLAIFFGVYYALENNDAIKPATATDSNGTISESEMPKLNPAEKSQNVPIPTHHSDTK